MNISIHLLYWNWCAASRTDNIKLVALIQYHSHTLSLSHSLTLCFQLVMKSCQSIIWINFEAHKERYIWFQSIRLELLDGCDEIDWVRDRTNNVHFKWRLRAQTQIEKYGNVVKSITMGTIHFILTSFKIYAIHPEFYEIKFCIWKSNALNCFDFQKIPQWFRTFFSFVHVHCFACSSPGIIRNSFVWRNSFIFTFILNMKLASIINFDLSCRVKKMWNENEEEAERERERGICGRNQ